MGKKTTSIKKTGKAIAATTTKPESKKKKNYALSTKRGSTIVRRRSGIATAKTETDIYINKKMDRLAGKAKMLEQLQAMSDGVVQTTKEYARNSIRKIKGIEEVL